MRCMSLRRPVCRWPLGGTVAPAAVCFADLLGCGHNQLVVGTYTGQLMVLASRAAAAPGSSCEAGSRWARRQCCVQLASLRELGAITCVCCGQLGLPAEPEVAREPGAIGSAETRSSAARCVCVVIADTGLCHILSLSRATTATAAAAARPVGAELRVDEGAGAWQLRVLLQQRLPANIKWSALSDVDGDGSCELVVALTDRVLRVYRYRGAPQHQGDQSSSSAAAAGGGGKRPEKLQLPRLAAVSKCELMQQIGGMAVVPRGPDSVSPGCVLLSQPAASVVCVQLSVGSGEDGQGGELLARCVDGVDAECGASGPEQLLAPDTEDEQAVLADTASCEVAVLPPLDSCGGCSAGGTACCVLATTDGQLLAVERRGAVQWRRQLHHQLFCLQWLPPGNGGGAEGRVAVSSWDGVTHLVERGGAPVRYLLDHSVLAFRAGVMRVARDSGADCMTSPRWRDVLSFAYVTTDGQLLLFHDVSVTAPSISCHHTAPTIGSCSSCPCQLTARQLRRLRQLALYHPQQLLTRNQLMVG